jgi:hypothetical protein
MQFLIFAQVLNGRQEYPGLVKYVGNEGASNQLLPCAAKLE